jgi:hypothetical protein
LLHAILSSFYWRILKKTILFSGFKNLYKKIRETRKLKSTPEKHFVERKENEGRNQTNKNSILRILDSETSNKNGVQEFLIRMDKYL